MKRKAWIISLGCVAVMAAMIIDPILASTSIKDGLNLFAVSVLPSMLPFFFLSSLLTATGLATVLSRRAGKLVTKLYGAPPIGFYVMILSCLSGYPVGAKLTAELYQKGMLSEQGAKSILPFTSSTGPMFIVGAVGAGLLGSAKAGLCIAAAHYLATMLNGLLFRRKKAASDVAIPISQTDTEQLLWNTAQNTATSLLVAGVFIVMFNLFGDVAQKLMLTDAIVNEFVILGMRQDIATALTFGIFEMTRGCSMLAIVGTPKAVAPLCAFLVTFGGLSVTLQSVAYLAKCKISPGYYLLTKTTQSLLALGLGYIFCLLL